MQLRKPCKESSNRKPFYCEYTLSLTYDTKQTALLSIMSLSAVGYVLVLAGIFIKNTEGIDHDDDDSGLLQAMDMLFAGGLITTFFWVRLPFT